MPAMTSDWFYTQQGKAAPAPIPAAQLRQLALTGQLQPTDLVWQDGMPNWVPASSVKGLFAPASTSRSRNDAPLEQPALPPKPPGPGILGLHPFVVLLLTLVTF